MRRLTWLVVAGACSSGRPWGHATTIEATASAPRTIDIAVSRTAFTPDHVVVKVGEAVTLRFTRMVEHTCAKEVVISLDASHDVRRTLAVAVPVAIALHFDRAGELGYACGMAMLGGTIEVRP